MHIEQLGPYRIGKTLGRGGMGSVHEAWDNTSGARVAVKILSPHLAMTEGFRDRFEAEIDSLKKLQHAGIVRLFGYGQQDGILFYSMELVEGTSLEEEIAAGRRFDWREALDIGGQVCRALKHAHDHGVVHRDIKPANLLLAEDGQIKIADFGIARLFGGNQLTTAGGVLGTADYMSPEQADGSPVTDKCDQYSLGGVLYALLAGQPPFRAKSLPEMLQLQRFAEPVPVRRYAPDAPEQLERLILQLLSKEPENRFPNVMVLGRHMEAMAKALARSVPQQEDETQGPPAGPISSTSPHKDRTTAHSRREATRALEENSRLPTGVELLPPGMENVPSHLFDAPTVAAPLAGTEDGDAAEENRRVAASTQAAEIPVPGMGKRRFTTVDQDNIQRQTTSSGNLLSLVAQLLGIVAALSLLVWGGWKLMQPATADDLYARIMEAVEEKGTENLRMIEKPLQEFNQRFAEDHRNVELDKFREELKLQQMERKLRRRVQIGNARPMSPIGQIYGMAINTAATDPQRGVEMLSSLLALYDPEGWADPAKTLGQANSTNSERKRNLHAPSSKNLLNEEDRRWLVLARRQYDRLLDRGREQQSNLSQSLHERLRLALKLQTTHPEVATRMFQAIVNLYSKQTWAAEIVTQARFQLKMANPTKELP